MKVRSEKNIILVSANLKEAAQHLTNVVPIKSYDGKKSKNNTLMSMVDYLYKYYLKAEDVREIVAQDFLT